jgi:heme-degrading monooxygenase HmoA
MAKAEPLILRRWSSRIRTEDRDEYVSYIKGTGVEDYLGTPGNVGCEMLLRDCGDGSTEVSTLSWWRSMEAIRAFAGDDVDRARYYSLDDRFLIAKPEFVEHHVIVVEALGLSGHSAPPGN